MGIAEDALIDEVADDLAAIAAERAALDAREIHAYARAARIAEAQTSRLRSQVSAERELPWRRAAAMIATHLHQHDRTSQRRMDDALQLTRLFPATVAALEAGRASARVAGGILDSGARLGTSESRAAFERVVLEYAETHTPGVTLSFAARLAERIDPRPLSERHADARTTRGVSVEDLGDGMARFTAILTSVEAHGIYDRLTRQAKALRDASHPACDPASDADAAAPASGAPARPAAPEAACAGGADAAADRFVDERTRDQVRADLFTDLLLTGAPAIDPTRAEREGGLGAIRAHVQITIPVTTLTGVTDGGVELDGRAPVDAETARCLAGYASTWDRLLTDPLTGTVLAVDAYRVPLPLQRHLRARDAHCRFPGCRMPAHRCELDHTHDYARGGRTEAANLAHLCTRHHTMKHATDWTVRQLPGGTLEWTSPTGRTTLDHPPGRVVFVPDDPAPPPPF